MIRVLNKIQTLLPNTKDDQETKFFKIIVYVSLGLITLMLISGVTVFFAYLQGQEAELVPNVVGWRLDKALVELQTKHLNSKIELRYTSDPAEKGMVVGLNPKPGSQVKTDSVIKVMVSQGSIINRIDNYVGWTYNDLEQHLLTLNSTFGPLLKIKQPVVRVYDEVAPAGTILEQSPEPGTELSGPTELALVVSNGPKVEIILEDYVGMDFRKAMDNLIQHNIPFDFFVEEPQEEARGGIVISQSLPTGKELPAGAILRLGMTKPENIKKGYVFGILATELKSYPNAVDLRMDKIIPDGERETVFTMKHYGGQIGIPYLEPVNTVLIISIYNYDLIRYKVTAAP